MKKFLLLLFAFLLVFPLPASAEEPLPEEGDVLLFGRYEQDGDPDNGPEPIQWLVLEADDETLLLITEYEIAYRVYSNRRDELVSWEDSDLRAWLNDQFLAFAFSEEERSFIAETPLHTPGGKHTITGYMKHLEVEAVLPSATLGLILQLTPKLSLQLKLHAFLLWSGI